MGTEAKTSMPEKEGSSLGSNDVANNPVQEEKYQPEAEVPKPARRPIYVSEVGPVTITDPKYKHLYLTEQEYPDKPPQGLLDIHGKKYPIAVGEKASFDAADDAAHYRMKIKNPPELASDSAHKDDYTKLQYAVRQYLTNLSKDSAIRSFLLHESELFAISMMPVEQTARKINLGISFPSIALDYASADNGDILITQSIGIAYLYEQAKEKLKDKLERVASDRSYAILETSFRVTSVDDNGQNVAKLMVEKHRVEVFDIRLIYELPFLLPDDPKRIKAGISSNCQAVLKEINTCINEDKVFSYFTNELKRKRFLYLEAPASMLRKSNAKLEQDRFEAQENYSQSQNNYEAKAKSFPIDLTLPPNTLIKNIGECNKARIEAVQVYSELRNCHRFIAKRMAERQLISDVSSSVDTLVSWHCAQEIINDKYYRAWPISLRVEFAIRSCDVNAARRALNTGIFANWRGFTSNQLTAEQAFQLLETFHDSREIVDMILKPKGFLGQYFQGGILGSLFGRDFSELFATDEYLRKLKIVANKDENIKNAILCNKALDIRLGVYCKNHPEKPVENQGLGSAAIQRNLDVAQLSLSVSSPDLVLLATAKPLDRPRSASTSSGESLSSSSDDLQVLPQSGISAEELEQLRLQAGRRAEEQTIPADISSFPPVPVGS